MLTLNTKIDNIKFSAMNDFSKNNIKPLSFGKDEFVKNKKDKYDVIDIASNIIKTPKALNIVKDDLELMQKCKKSVKEYDNGSKLVTFYKGFKFFPKAYRGEMLLNNKNRLIYMIMQSKCKSKEYDKFNKTVYISNTIGIRVVLEKMFNIYSKVEKIYDLQGNLFYISSNV